MAIDVKSLIAAQATLTALNSAMLSLATNPVAEVNIDGQMTRFHSIKDVQDLIYVYERKVAILGRQRVRTASIRFG